MRLGVIPDRRSMAEARKIKLIFDALFTVRFVNIEYLSIKIIKDLHVSDIFSQDNISKLLNRLFLF